MRFNLKQEFLYNFNEILLWVKPVITEDVFCWASTSGLMATNASGYWWLVLSKRVALVGKDVCRRLIAVRLLFPFDPLCLFFSTPLPPFGVHEAALFFSISLSLSLSLRPTATSLGNGFTCGRAHAKGGSSLAHFSKEISPSNVLQSVEINRLHVSTKALPLPLTSPPPTPPPDTLPRPISWFPIPGGFSKKMFSSFSLHQRFSFPFSSFTGFQLVLLSFTGFYLVLLSFTGFYLVLLGFT